MKIKVFICFVDKICVLYVVWSVHSQYYSYVSADIHNLYFFFKEQERGKYFIQLNSVWTRQKKKSTRTPPTTNTPQHNTSLISLLVSLVRLCMHNLECPRPASAKKMFGRSSPLQKDPEREIE